MSVTSAGEAAPAAASAVAAACDIADEVGNHAVSKRSWTHGEFVYSMERLLLTFFNQMETVSLAVSLGGEAMIQLCNIKLL